MIRIRLRSFDRILRKRWVKTPKLFAKNANHFKRTVDPLAKTDPATSKNTNRQKKKIRSFFAETV